MEREIRESDWKLFRQLRPLALDRFCQRVLAGNRCPVPFFSLLALAQANREKGMYTDFPAVRLVE